MRNELQAYSAMLAPPRAEPIGAELAPGYFVAEGLALEEHVQAAREPRGYDPRNNHGSELR